MFWCPNSGDECEHRIVQNPKSAFLIMPYNYPKEHLDEINNIETIIKDCFNEIDFSVKSAREIRRNRNLLCKICETMQSVAIGIVVYTKNTPKTSLPNIFYEAGIMHSLGKEVIFIGHKVKRPSDLSGMEWIHADTFDELREKIKEHLAELSELASYYNILGENEEVVENYEKASEYYMKAILISPETSIMNLENLYEEIKDYPGYNNISKKVNNFLTFL